MWSDLQPFFYVLLEYPAGRSAKRHPSGLSELAFGYVKLLFGAVEVNARTCLLDCLVTVPTILLIHILAFRAGSDRSNLCSRQVK